jgi:[acyl-carrier-protein] S-malonyltransferase
MKRYALICPGRGSYTEASLGSLNRVYNDGDAAARALIEQTETWRAETKLPSLLELDASQRFSAALHLRPANVSALIWLATMLDVQAERARRLDETCVAVAGNSMGWYTALAVGGALSLQDGYRLVQDVALMQEAQRAGGQLIYPIMDSAWRVDAQRVAAIEHALATSDNQAFLSIELGGFRVLAGTDLGMAHMMRELPPIAAGEMGRVAYPLRLAQHGPYHTTLLSDVALRAESTLTRLDWRRPELCLVDGRGSLFTPWATNTGELLRYTLGHQITRPYDFTRSVRVVLRELAPDQLVLPGPGNTLGGITGQILCLEGWRGIHSRTDFDREQAGPRPLVHSMHR